MIPVRKIALAFLLIPVCFFSCRDEGRIIDENVRIAKNTWSYVDRPKFEVNITDASVPYNLYLNIRHTPYYAYSNLFTVIRQINPDGKSHKTRFEFKLAYPDGQWTGQGSGNLYSHQIAFRERYTFPKAGKYVFEIEQNMRDNPLREITDAGLRVEKAQ
ncbi:MAG: gliding motility lipoprotein GldH [Mucilaginibacter polytrichastri]|nr:gliding motility lipoprotein GldH [Mucilaginibacter polytrichastri]